jgi:hypothetical protein
MEEDESAMMVAGSGPSELIELLAVLLKCEGIRVLGGRRACAPKRSLIQGEGAGEPQDVKPLSHQRIM